MNIENYGIGFDASRSFNPTDYLQYCDYDPFDGLHWEGSVEASLNSDWIKWLQKSQPKIRYDFKSINPNFEYVTVAKGQGNYIVYALTNNKTILQPVGFLYLYTNDNFTVPTGADLTVLSSPVENYTPEKTEMSSITTVDGEVFNYSEPGPYYEQRWISANDSSRWGFTKGIRNPVGLSGHDSIYFNDFNYSNIRQTRVIETITVNGNVYTYDGETQDGDYKWINSENNLTVTSDYNINPSPGWMVTDGEEWDYIDNVTFVSWYKIPVIFKDRFGL